MKTKGTRADGREYHIVDSCKRGDQCFSGRVAGWYWYLFDAQWGIDVKTITGPFRSAENAFRDMETKSGMSQERAYRTIGTPPEHPCPVETCCAKPGEWCLVLPGGIGWQHDARPASSWER